MNEKKAIVIKNLSKRFVIGAKQTDSLRESLTGFFRKNKPAAQQEFWALKNVSFDVDSGQAIGIIGHNGAGKSTLLKVLSRITDPTEGVVEINGRVASLLEVGTGFHPELTGRENIFMNGTILGMTRSEIKNKFDEIVEFSGVSKFIDTPVKHYSSGMYVRLAFAVAAHLEPEILIIDEVLAVGDAEFQKKCLGKMKDVSKNHGRTVLFVSHNMTAIQTLCDKAILLEHGQISESGAAKDVVNKYLQKEASNILSRTWGQNDAPGSDTIKILAVKALPHNADDQIDVRSQIELQFEFLSLAEDEEMHLSFHLYNLEGECIFNLGSNIIRTKKGRLTAQCVIPPNFLNDGAYYINLMIIKDRSKLVYNLEEALHLQVEDYREGAAWYGKWPGAVRPTFINFNLVQQ